MPAITMLGCIVTGEKTMSIDSSSTICRHTRRTSTRSNGYGNSPGDNASTTATFHSSTRSSIPSKPNSNNGSAATVPCVDYAQLLKTLCLVPCYARFLKQPMKKAFACSLAVSSALAIPGTLVHSYLGHISWLVTCLLLIWLFQQ